MTSVDRRIDRVERLLARGDTEQALAVVDEIMDYNQPLSTDMAAAVRCHDNPREVLECRTDGTDQHIWVHTERCTSLYYEALARIDGAKR